MVNPLNIGTPLSCSATRVMLLPSGELGTPIIIASQATGYRNHCGVLLPKRARASGCAPRPCSLIWQTALRCGHWWSMSGHILSCQRSRPLTGALLIVIVVSRESLALIPTARAAQLTMNREEIRRLAGRGAGLPTSPYVFASTLEALAPQREAGIGFPCIVKPVMSSNPGKGQSTTYGPGKQARVPAWNYVCEWR